jgi:hypothetical protein
VLLLLVDFLRAPSSAARVGADHPRLLEAAEMLVRIANTMDTSGTTTPPSRVERMLSAWKRYLALAECWPDLRTPKRHAVAHMILSAPRLGNPRCFSNWYDEALNRVLKGACRTISQATFEQSVLLRMPELITARKRPRD